MEVLASSMKTLTGMAVGEFDNDRLIELAKQLLQSNGFDVDINSLAYRIFMSKLTTSLKVKNELLASFFEGDALSELCSCL